MLDKLERKLGRYAIPHLMRYIIIGNAVVFLISLFYPDIVLLLNCVPTLILEGQVWRLVTFILVPPLGSPLLTAFSLFCYYWIGESLERTWGSFKFGVYYFLGWLCMIACMFIVGLLTDTSYAMISSQMTFFNQSLFLALAALYPEMRILIFYFIPLKAKWAGYLSAAILLVEFFLNGFSIKMLMIASFIPFLLFFLPDLISRLKNARRRNAYQKSANPYAAPGREAYNKVRTQGRGEKNGSSNITRAAFHRCHVCGMTELDNPNMTFRYCSQCNGSYEYCENHIHNHQHIQ